MRTVVHIGPSKSPGGMASIIGVLASNPPSGWKSKIIQTSGATIISKFLRWFSAKSELRNLIFEGEVDIAHIHVSHSISWWRKRSMMRICERYGVPTLVHIHSGKFEKFCSGIGGKSVTKELSKKNRKTILLEKRWEQILSRWLPEDVEVVNNCSRPIAKRDDHKLNKSISLLLLSRKSSIKGHNFAMEILEKIEERGLDVSLTMTGISNIEVGKKYSDMIVALGWVDEEFKSDLVKKSDFLISPSEFEGSSMSIIEAMVSGLPCIVSKTSEETVGSRKFVVESSDPGEWAERIVKLHNPEEYSKAVEETIENAKIYEVGLSVEKFSQIYKEIL